MIAPVVRPLPDWHPGYKACERGVRNAWYEPVKGFCSQIVSSPTGC